LSSRASHARDFLEVKGLNEGKELVFGVFEIIVDQSGREEHRIVSHLDLLDCMLDPNLEFVLSLDSVSNAATKLLKTGWVDKEEVAFKSLLVYFNGTFYIHFYDRDLARIFDSRKLGVTGSVPASFRLFPELNELLLQSHPLELRHCDEVEILLSLFCPRTNGSRGVRPLTVKDITVVTQNHVYKCALTHSRGANQDQWLVL